jgi:threonine aldolase
VHVDGARLFNAQVATGVPVARIVESATTVMSCLSKGLAAPVGSLLAGPAELMVTARRERKRLGGAMRQAGVIAAAGLVALDTMIDRLADDHGRARRLAVAVHERWPETRVDPDHLPTNVVVFAHRDTTALIGHLRSRQVLAGSIAPGVMRLMTHLDVDDFGLERAVDAISVAP